MDYSLSLFLSIRRQDGDVFRCAAARMLRHLEPAYADLCCGNLSLGGCPRWVVRPMVLEIG